MATKNLSDYDITSVPDASNMIFGVVVAEWNPEITGALLDGCVSTLEKHGALPENIHVKTVPGSFELIYGARQMTLNDGYDAVIILGMYRICTRLTSLLCFHVIPTHKVLESIYSVGSVFSQSVRFQWALPKLCAFTYTLNSPTKVLLK